LLDWIGHGLDVIIELEHVVILSPTYIQSIRLARRHIKSQTVSMRKKKKKQRVLDGLI